MIMNKLLEILSKLGILKYGAAAGTYRNATEAPDDFEYMNMSRKKNATAEEANSVESTGQQGTMAGAGELDAPMWVIIATWVLGTLLWLVAIDAFINGKNLIGFWLTLAGLVTVHHTNQLLAVIGIDLSLLWRVIVVAVCMLAIAF